MFDRSSKHRPLTLLNFVQINNKNRDTYRVSQKNTFIMLLEPQCTGPITSRFPLCLEINVLVVSFKSKPYQAFPSHVQMSNFSPQLSILVIILIYQYIFLGHHVHKDKEKQNTYQTTYQDWQKQWKQASEGRCQILFHGFVLKNYGNLRKVRRFDPRQIQTVSKMVQSRPKDASKLNPTCCKDVPKSSQSFYSKYSYKHKAYLAVSNFYSRAQQRQIQRQTH